MTAVWVAAGVGIAVVVVRWFTRHTSDGAADRGFISDRWIAEHRVSDMHDPGAK
jgi:hypothetical protein